MRASLFLLLPACYFVSDEELKERKCRVDSACDTATPTLWYLDADGDGFGDPVVTLISAEVREGYVLDDTDCDDDDPSVHPGAAETCDGVDNNCSGDESDASDVLVWHADADGDGYGAADSARYACEQPARYLSDDTDCDDRYATVHPGADEICDDGLINDCDDDAAQVRQDCALLGDIAIAERAAATMLGEAEGDQAGSQVAGAGDMNEDGRNDLMIAAFQAVADAGSVADGKVYIVRGEVAGAQPLAESLATISGDDEQAGFAISGGTDVNGDAHIDLLIGANATDVIGTDEGAAYLLLGPVTGDIHLKTADAMLWGDSAEDLAGYTVNTRGDINGDGRADLLVGTPFDADGGSGAGAAWLVLYPEDMDLSGADAKLIGERPGDGAGCAVSMPGDTDGDGQEDLVVSAFLASDGADDQGIVYVAVGPFDGPSELSDVDGTLRGEAADDRAGVALAAPGDVNGDGYADLLVGADASSEDVGGAYLVHGPILGETSLAESVVKLVGDDADDLVGAGYAVAAPGDMDADGAQDLVVGAWSYLDCPSAAFLVYGPFDGVVQLSDAREGLVGSRLIQEMGCDALGSSLAGVGDTNEDGRADLLIGAPWYADASKQGAAYLVLGSGL